MLSLVVFFLGLGSIGAITSLAVAQLFVSNFEFWPPPSTKSWQHLAFRILFRTFFICLIVLSVLGFEPQDLWRYVFGGGLLAIGFGLALRWTGYLGWDNAFGDDTGLRTKGPFSISRNPIYMVSILGMLGWSVLVNSDLLTGLLFLWAVLYLVAPFTEEPWMREHYGDEYEEYESKVARYVELKAALSPFELKIPPLAIVLISAGFMYFLAQTIRHEELFQFPLRLTSFFLIEVLALAILLAALVAFKKHETTMNPLVPDNANVVVRTGIYRHSRNPMYLSMFIVLFGWAIFLGQLSALAALPVYFLLMTQLQILPEEKVLTEKFGDPYLNYCQTTSRWIGF